MKKMPRVYDLVTISWEPNADIFRVKEIDAKSKKVGVIDATKDTEQEIKWLHVSLLEHATRLQMQFHGLI